MVPQQQPNAHTNAHQKDKHLFVRAIICCGVFGLAWILTRESQAFSLMLFCYMFGVLHLIGFLGSFITQRRDSEKFDLTKAACLAGAIALNISTDPASLLLRITSWGLLASVFFIYESRSFKEASSGNVCALLFVIGGYAALLSNAIFGFYASQFILLPPALALTGAAISRALDRPQTIANDFFILFAACYITMYAAISLPNPISIFFGAIFFVPLLRIIILFFSIEKVSLTE